MRRIYAARFRTVDASALLTPLRPTIEDAAWLNLRWLKKSRSKSILSKASAMSGAAAGAAGGNRSATVRISAVAYAGSVPGNAQSVLFAVLLQAHQEPALLRR